jgi:DNA-binding beta-propeller fold protein YncE
MTRTQPGPGGKGIAEPVGAAVDTGGDLYVADAGNNRVLKLVASSAAATVLPVTGLDYPNGVAVDAAGNVYVTDNGNNQVVKLAAGSATQSVLPFTRAQRPLRCGGGHRRQRLRHRP